MTGGKSVESTAPDQASVDLSYYAAVLRRRWKLAAFGLVVGILASVAVLYVQPHRATASALVNVNPIADNAFSSSRPASDLLVPETEQAMARSTEVVTRVSDLSVTTVSPAEVRANMVATLLPESTVLRIDYTAPTAREAADGAALVSQEYLAYRSSVAQERIELAVDQLEKRRKKLNTDLVDANQEAAAAEDGPGKAASESRAQSVQADLTSVNSQVNQLRAISTSGGTIISHPDSDRVAIAPNRPMMLFSGVLGGLLLALVLPFLANAFDRRVRDPHDVARAGGGAVVATLTEPQAVVPAGEEDADQIRALRERLMAVMATSSPVVVVADVGTRASLPGDLAANLAVLVADAGRDTTLLLANYSDEAFGELVASLGLAEGRFVHGARHFHSRVVTSLMVVVPAPAVDRVSNADVVAGLLQDERRRGSVTIVGVAPGGGQSVRLTAARLAHQVVLNVPSVSTRTTELAEVVDALRAVGAPIHGTVLTHGDRVLEGDAALVPKHPLAGRKPERFAEQVEDDDPDEQSELLMFSPWFYRAQNVNQHVPDQNGQAQDVEGQDGTSRAGLVEAAESSPERVRAFTGREVLDLDAADAAPHSDVADPDDLAEVTDAHDADEDSLVDEEADEAVAEDAVQAEGGTADSDPTSDEADPAPVGQQLG